VVATLSSLLADVVTPEPDTGSGGNSTLVIVLVAVAAIIAVGVVARAVRRKRPQ
jgi:hypothetical protein